MAARKKRRTDIDGAADAGAETAARYADREKRIRAMLDRHMKNSIWLKAREPLLHALVDVAIDADTGDASRLRALEKIADMLERAEDEKRSETFDGVEESVEASLRRLEAAIRRGGRDTES